MKIKKSKITVFCFKCNEKRNLELYPDKEENRILYIEETKKNYICSNCI